MHLKFKHLRSVSALLVFLLVFSSIQPVVTYALDESVKTQAQQEKEFIINDKGLVTANPDYKDNRLKPLQTSTLGVDSSEYPLGTGLDPQEQLAAVSKKVRYTQEQDFGRSEIETLKKVNKDKARLVNENKKEFATNNNVKIVEQNFVKKFVKDGKTLKQIEFAPAQKNEKLTTGSGTLTTEYTNSTDGIKIQTPAGSFVLRPKATNNVKAEITGDAVIYKNIWDGVDLVYEYKGDWVKEYIVLNNTNAPTDFYFQLEGAVASNSLVEKGGIDLKVGNSDLYIDPLNVIAAQIGPVSEEIISQSVDNNEIKVTLNADWLKSLKNENFPVAIDPGVVWGQRPVETNNTAYRAYKSDGYVCDYVYCDINTGGLSDNGQKSWRSTVRFDFSELSGKNFLGAYIEMQMSTKSYRWNGFYNTNSTINVAYATCQAYSCISPNSPVATATMTSAGTVDVYNLFQYLVNNNKWNGWLIMWGEENRTDTYKAFDAAYMKLNYAYNAYPNNNATLRSPANNAVVTSPNVILRTNAATDPDGDQLQYNFVLKDSAGTIIQQSGFSKSLSMPVADGVLRDGATYTWQLHVGDTYYLGHPTPAYSATFKTDFRTGKDSTQSYDEAGPFVFNLATGNAYTASGSHSIAALGGLIAIGLDYNSPVLTREGLSAKYWNNNNWSGDPVLSRIDSNIDFEWSFSTPFPGVVNLNNWSASWNGYFIAPETGNYKFGTSADDDTKIYGNGTLLLNAPCCSLKWMSGTVALTKGQAYPIRVDYNDLGGNAFMSFYVQLPAGTQMIVPSEYLRTTPVSTTQNRGLTGKYYLDDGSHNFATNKKRFLLRNEPVIDYNWTTGSPLLGGPVDNFLVKYEGFITAPITGLYKIGVNSDDGVKIYLNGNLIAQNWTDHAPTDTWSQDINLTAGSLNKVVIEYYEKTDVANISLKWDGPAGLGVIENKYLSPEAQLLPAGWNLSIDGSSSIPYESLKVRPNADVIMITSDGTESLYTATNNGYKPPVNEDGWLIKNDDNSYTFTDVAGSIYIYDELDNSGRYKLRESSSP